MAGHRRPQAASRAPKARGSQVRGATPITAPSSHLPVGVDAVSRDHAPALEALIPACWAARVGIVAAAAFNTGLLASSLPGPGARDEYTDVAADVLERVRRIEDVCAEYGVALPVAALQCPLRDPAVRSLEPAAAALAAVRITASGPGCSSPSRKHPARPDLARAHSGRSDGQDPGRASGDRRCTGVGGSRAGQRAGHGARQRGRPVGAARPDLSRGVAGVQRANAESRRRPRQAR